MLKAGGATLDRQQHCRLRLTLCTVNAAEQTQQARARTDDGSSPLASTREERQRTEAECFAALLLEEEEGRCCSIAVDGDTISEERQLAVGLFRLCEEWDVSRALDHFLAATTCNHRRRGSLEEPEQVKERQVLHEDGPEWGAVWLAQASVLTILLHSFTAVLQGGLRRCRTVGFWHQS